MKLITFAVPCYNSAAYLAHCVQSLLPGGDEVEIILINDGSTDETGTMCNQYAQQYPNIIRAIHQKNGGHGAGVQRGMQEATGLYYKVVDSDDWADPAALKQVLATLRSFAAAPHPPDLLICNYVYEHTADNTQKVMRYTNVFPQNRCFTWAQTNPFRLSQYLLMHSVFYRTRLLQACGIHFPRHTFYVDNIFVYQPLPFVKTLYYMDVDFYRYFIGRADQSVNEAVMVKQVDHQLRVTKQMIAAHNLQALKQTQPKLAKYMENYLSMMISISNILLMIDGSENSMAKQKDLWLYLRRQDKFLYYKMRYCSLSAATSLPGKWGRQLPIAIYRAAQKVFRFN